MPEKVYTESKKVLEPGERFVHVMAITLDPRTENKEGIARCILSRSDDIQIKGNVDRSKLHKIIEKSSGKFVITEPLIIKNDKEIIGRLTGQDDFIGLEDPDIWIDEEKNLMHVYFTIPIKPFDEKKKIKIHLGHAVGKDFDSLEMIDPVLLDNGKASAKEVSIAPLNSKGFRYNLIESRDRRPEQRYSIVKVAIVHDMGKDWDYGDTVFHPADHNLPWIAGHASPGPLLPQSFIDIGEGKMLGIMNGCEADQKLSDGRIKYGTFSIGLFIYDYENGKIEWVSSKPIIQDNEAIRITFASQFVVTNPGEGILYAHVDDSFVRSYHLNAEEIKKLLPNF